MVIVTEHEWRATNGDRAIGPSGKQLSGVNDIDRAEAKALIDIHFLAKR